MLPLALDALSLTLRDVVDDDSKWVGEGLRQKGVIADHTTAPQILLVGGSNVNYGYSAAQIEREFSVPATNLAVHAGLGRRYIFWDCLRHAKRGDLVVLGLEYALYDHLFCDPAERYQVFIYDRTYYEQRAWSEKVDLARQHVAGRLGGAMAREGRLAETWRRYPAGPQPTWRPDGQHRPDVRLQEGRLSKGWSVQSSPATYATSRKPCANAEQSSHLSFRTFATPSFDGGSSLGSSPISAKRRTPRASVSSERRSRARSRRQYAYNTNYHLNAEGTRIATRRLMRELAEAGARLPAHPSR